MSLDQRVADLEAMVRKLERREPPLAAEFVDTATSPADELRVKAPGWDEGEHTFGPVRWSPIGGALPQAGDEAVIVERDDGVWQVVAWWSDQQTGGPAVEGAFVGQIVMHGRASTPTLWLPCDGAAVSRTIYADLFTALGTTWGAGNGTTTFNVPDLKGRAPIGTGTGSGLTARSAGAKVGVETHQLSTSEMPAHDHPPGGGASFFNVANSITNNGGAGAVGVLGTAAVSRSVTGSTGGDGAHQNMQPSIAVPFAIYAGV